MSLGQQDRHDLHQQDSRLKVSIYAVTAQADDLHSQDNFESGSMRGVCDLRSAVCAVTAHAEICTAKMTLDADSMCKVYYMKSASMLQHLLLVQFRRAS